MDEMETAIRTLIRGILRENGIKHRSDHNGVWALTYAQHPLFSIQYLGPIYISYQHVGNNPHIRAAWFAFDEKLSIAASIARYHKSLLRYNEIWRKPLCKWRVIEGVITLLLLVPAVIIALLIGRHSPRSRRVVAAAQRVVPYPLATDKFRNVVVADELVCHLGDPNLCDKLSAFLQKYIPEEERRPGRHRRLIKLGDQYRIARYRVDVNDRRSCRVRRAMSYLSIDPNFYLRHAIKRYYQTKADEWTKIREIASELRSMPRKDIKADTALMLNLSE